MSLRYLSICSGIEAASVAWEPLGFTAAGFSEIDPFASAVLAERFGSNLPGEPLSRNAPPNFGDFTAIDLAALGPVDLLVGGTPCQAFSFAGKRLSLADARGNLTLAFAVLAHELARSHGLRNALWENVPGVLSTPDNAFGCFLGALVGADDALLPSERPRRGRSTAVWRWVEAGRWPVLDDNGEETGEFVDRPEGHVARWPRAGMVAGPLGRAAWRVLDAQYFGLAQRRERVFVVFDSGNGADPAAVLFEPQSLQGNSPPRREAGQKPAPTVAGGARSRGGYSTDDVPLTSVMAHGQGGAEIAHDQSPTLTCNHEAPIAFIADLAATLPAGGNATGGNRYPGTGAETAGTMLIAHTLRGEGFDASEDGTGRGTPIIPVALRGHSDYGNGLPCLRAEGGDAGGGSEALIAFSCKDHGADAADDLAPTLRAMGHGESHANAGGQVAVAFSIMPQNSGKDYKAREVEVAQPLMAGGPVGGNQGGDFILQPLAFAQNSRDEVRLQGGDGQIVGALAAEPGMKQTTYIQQGWAVRRLTPPECARLQGFPDHHSRIAWRGKAAELCPDGPQYKTYGNSMAVTVMRWLGERVGHHLKALEKTA